MSVTRAAGPARPDRAAAAVAAGLIGILAAGSGYLGRSSGVPAPIIAVLGGFAVGALLTSDGHRDGYTLWARPGLKLGVSLLGAQLSWAELLSMGPGLLAASGLVVLSSLTVGALAGLAIGLPAVEALIAACAVSICGASAAMAAASALPESVASRRTTALVVVGVNLLSTLAMVLYPLIASGLGLSDRQTGVFLGLSIHDMAQVMGAAAGVSPEAAGAAALAKLSRILWLGPAVMLVALALRLLRGGGRAGGAFIKPPALLWGFLAFMAARNLGLLPSAALTAMGEASRLLLLGGAAAIAAQVRRGELAELQPRLVVALIGASVFIAVAALAASKLW